MWPEESHNSGFKERGTKIISCLETDRCGCEALESCILTESPCDFPGISLSFISPVARSHSPKSDRRFREKRQATVLHQICFPLQLSATSPSAVSSYFLLAFLCVKLSWKLMSQCSVKQHSHLCLSVMLTVFIYSQWEAMACSGDAITPRIYKPSM